MSKKHLKLRNTGILFEILIRKSTSEIVSSVEQKAFELLKEYFFGKDREISKELNLYHTLIKEKFTKDRDAQILIDAVLQHRLKLNQQKLRDEKYKLIAEISKHYDVDDFFSNRIENYKEFAAISKVFDDALGQRTDPAEITRCRCTLLEHIVKSKKETDESVILEDFNKLDNDLKILTYKVVVEKFNNKYSKLSTKQRTLLREYINSISDNKKLSAFVKEECNYVTNMLDKYIPKVKDDITKIKLDELKNQAKGYLIADVVGEKQILNLMNYYQVLSEVRSILKSKNVTKAVL